MIGRRSFLAAAGAGTVVLAAGCSGDDDPKPGRPGLLDWLRGLDGVAGARTVPDENDTEGEHVELRLVDGLPETDVRAVVERMKSGWEERAGDYNPSVRVVVESFVARVYPRPTSVPEVDLERLLWLRSDGRALSSSYDGGSGMDVVAPAAAVAAVALGFDARGKDGVRLSHEVASPDRDVVIAWQYSEGLGFGLDRKAVTEFAALQRRYPGLTGWTDSLNGKSGVYFAAADVGLDRVLSERRRPGNLAVFGELELGWGPARGPANSFARVFGGELRPLAERLATVPGVTELRSEGGTLAYLPSVVVSSRAGLLGALATLRGNPETRDSFVAVRLVRAPSPYVGQAGPEVCSLSVFDDADTTALYTALADVPAVRQVYFKRLQGQLILAASVDRAQLHTTMSALAELPAAASISLLAATDPDPGLTSGMAPLGRIHRRRFRADPDAAPRFAARVRSAWRSAR